VPPSFETLAEFIIGPRFARTRWQAPQDEVGIASLDSFHLSRPAPSGELDCIPDGSKLTLKKSIFD
jgi:hypothetical protein